MNIKNNTLSHPKTNQLTSEAIAITAQLPHSQNLKFQPSKKANEGKISTANSILSQSYHQKSASQSKARSKAREQTGPRSSQKINAQNKKRKFRQSKDKLTQNTSEMSFLTSKKSGPLNMLSAISKLEALKESEGTLNSNKPAKIKQYQIERLRFNPETKKYESTLAHCPKQAVEQLKEPSDTIKYLSKVNEAPDGLDQTHAPLLTSTDKVKKVVGYEEVFYTSCTGSSCSSSSQTSILEKSYFIRGEEALRAEDYGELTQSYISSELDSMSMEEQCVYITCELPFDQFSVFSTDSSIKNYSRFEDSDLFAKTRPSPQNSDLRLRRSKSMGIRTRF